MNTAQRAQACPQCSSHECGPYRCRFSMLTHEAHRARLSLLEEIRVNAYADAKAREDRERLHTGAPEHDTDTAGRALTPGS